MILDRDLEPYVVLGEDSLARAMERISANHARVIFCVSPHGALEGALSDGDIRRWIAGRGQVDLSARAIDAANRSPLTAPRSWSTPQIEALFTSSIDHIPVVDERGRIVAVAINKPVTLRLGGFGVDVRSPALLVAEIGINHNGSVDLAKEFVAAAVASGADCVKFQMRDLSALYRTTSRTYDAEDLGPQYTMDLLSKFSLENDELFDVFDYCKELGTIPLCTPWDIPSVEALAGYGIPGLKIASADLTNHELIAHAGSRGLPMIVSTGMSSEAEIMETVGLLRDLRTEFALLHCNSTYPAPFKDVHLSYMRRLAELGQCPVGYSGHERGYHVVIAAIACGAKIIEKHFTLDRGMEGNDHKVSLLPDEFAAMVREVRDVEAALGSADARTVSPGEMMNRVNLAKSLVAARDLLQGETVAAEHVVVRSPGRGLQPNLLRALIGRTLSRPVLAGEFFYPSDLEDAQIQPRAYTFRRPWGLPVRYHDFATLSAQSNPDFAEFHLSYKDLEVDVSEILPSSSRLGLAVHSPDLFRGDHILNFAAVESDYWQRSIAELQRVIDLTNQLRQRFDCHDDPVVIVSLGGFSKAAHLPKSERKRMYERVADGIERLDVSGVRLCAQTLPPFPWYMGGQLHCNLFVDPRDTAWFAETFGVRLCLDVSHTKLATNWLGMSFSEGIEMLAPHAEHLHLVDAAGIDGEGLQVGDGEIDFAVLAGQLAFAAPNAGFIPEIWQGHVDGGNGFWIALDRLEAWY